MASVYFYIPNLIGYARIILAFVAFHYHSTQDWKKFVGYYCVSMLLDAIDGHAARYFNQSSRFGAVLDMVTDRFCSNVLIMILAFGALADHNPPKGIAFLIGVFFAVLDFVSHWFCMYQSLLCGETSHKSATKTRHWLVNIYYTNKLALFFVCCGQELFCLLIYSLHNMKKHKEFLEYENLIVISLCVIFPFFFFKQFINVQQMKNAADEMNHWEKMQSGKVK